jgi:hypothetical protein
MSNFDLRKYLAEGRLFKDGYEVEDFLNANFPQFKNDVAYDEGNRFEIPVKAFVEAINSNLDPYTGTLDFENGMITFMGGA